MKSSSSIHNCNGVLRAGIFFYIRLKPLNIFSQNFLFVCTYAPCLSTFVGLLFSVGEPMNKFTSIALSVFIVTATFSVICFRFGSAWETGERVLTQIYGARQY